ncbi:MAG: metalloregulator ArsR/SmtB family transcription factor [Verrucomicrobiota bacterium]|nr:metalloregulator ArsR/SmtB family transcription factor [Verrucomicrobiota bacterium]
MKDRNAKRVTSRKTGKRGVEAIFRAFADQTRLRIMVLLRNREVCVGDIVEVLNVSQPTASRHLASLRRSGLVVSRKEGQWIYYSLARANSQLLKGLFGCLKDCQEEMPAMRLDATRFQRLKQKGGCC